MTIKFKAALAYRADEPLAVEIVNVALPKDNEVLAEIKATGICHTDAYTLSGRDPEGLFAAISGHEGDVEEVAVGKHVTSVTPGDHVIAYYLTLLKTLRSRR
ncbi:alcohol dehydrogenase catalytic domain-containing protein, partial [Francisella tularensis]|uniref:alcohol dehydrogenase catalytic domain-containing protein n=1 Tax=Francisella tularensis TaxID=263 RepID=UPI00174A6991